MKKIIFISWVFMPLIWLLTGCSDKTVSPPYDTTYHFDSARYSWTIYSFNSLFITFDSFNDSDIFILNAGSLIQFNGINFIDHFFNNDGLYALSMGGYNKNSIYIGGDDITVPNNRKPRLKKWNGSAFEEILIPDSTNRLYQISTIFPISENEIWMGSTRGDLIHYKNGNFEFERIDSTFIFTEFGTDDLGNFFCVGQKTIFANSTTRYLDIYKKVNGNWEWTKVFSEKYVDYDLNEIIPSRMNTDIVGFQFNTIKKFMGNSFIEVFDIEPFVAYPVSQLSDTSINYFLMPGVYRQSLNGLKIFQWNGNKWSKELSFWDLKIYAQFVPKIKNVYSKYYFLATDEVSGISFIGKGVKIN